MAGIEDLEQLLVDAYRAQLGVLWRLGGAATLTPDGPAAVELAEQKASLNKIMGALVRKLRMQVPGAKDHIPLMSTLLQNDEEHTDDDNWEIPHKKKRARDISTRPQRLPRDWQEVHLQTSTQAKKNGLEAAANACVALATFLASAQTDSGEDQESFLLRLLSSCAEVQAHWKHFRLLSTTPWLSLGWRQRPGGCPSSTRASKGGAWVPRRT